MTNSSVALAVQSIAREKNKLVFYSAVGTTEISGKQCSETGLAWLHDSYNLVAGPVRRIVAQGLDTWFFISADYAFGRNIVSEAQRVLTGVGGKSVGTIFHPIGATDYSAFLLQAQASGAKVVAMGNAGVAVAGTEHFERFLRESLYRIAGIRHSRSTFALRALKNGASVDPLLVVG